MLLNFVLLDPSLLNTLDVGADLVFPEHRDCWQTMCRVHMRTPGLEAGAFFIEWLMELEAHGKARLVDVLDLTWYEIDGRPRWREQEEDADWQAFTRRHRRTIPPHRSVGYWLERVRACAEARRLIQAAQTMAERAWRLDLDGATKAAERAVVQRTGHLKPSEAVLDI
jgi:hypothetical protein